MWKEKLKKIPKPGMRIYKTALCVFLCLILNYFFGTQVALISSWAAIMCIQSTLENSLKVGVSRFLGTAIGGVYAILLLPVAQNTSLDWLYIIMMPLGIIVVIYTCVLLKMPGAASMGAFVYIGVLIIPFNPNSQVSPYLYSMYRVLDTMVGVAIALAVNRFISPPKLAGKSNVLINANTYPRIYDRVRSDLKDDVQLILFSTSLLAKTDNSMDAEDEGLFSKPAGNLCVPVPLEFQNGEVLSCAYIGDNYKVTAFELNQNGGYAEIPSVFYPATLVWHTQDNQKTLNSYKSILENNGTELPLNISAITSKRAAKRRKNRI